MSWLGRIFRRRNLYDELGEEVREHLDEKTEQLLLCIATVREPKVWSVRFSAQSGR